MKTFNVYHATSLAHMGQVKAKNIQEALKKAKDLVPIAPVIQPELAPREFDFYLEQLYNKVKAQEHYFPPVTH